jgi:hypothetical protein
MVKLRKQSNRGVAPRKYISMRDMIRISVDERQRVPREHKELARLPIFAASASR